MDLMLLLAQRAQQDKQSPDTSQVSKTAHFDDTSEAGVRRTRSMIFRPSAFTPWTRLHSGGLQPGNYLFM